MSTSRILNKLLIVNITFEQYFECILSIRSLKWEKYKQNLHIFTWSKWTWRSCTIIYVEWFDYNKIETSKLDIRMVELSIQWCITSICFNQQYTPKNKIDQTHNNSLAEITWFNIPCVSMELFAHAQFVNTFCRSKGWTLLKASFGSGNELLVCDLCILSVSN